MPPLQPEPLPSRVFSRPVPAPPLPDDTDYRFPENTCLLIGMHGMGDNIMQRAIVRDRLAKGKDVYLTTSWVSIYHDLVPQGLKIIRKEISLRSQTNNAIRENDLFYKGPHPSLARSKFIERIWYRHEMVNKLGSVLAAMCHSAKTPFETANFKLPVPVAWNKKLLDVVSKQLFDKKLTIDKPIMVVRPLLLRKDWGGCDARNPDTDSYMELYHSIRKHFFVISVADLKPNFEWIVNPSMGADLEFHNAELKFEELAALFQWASLVYCSPGFAAHLSQSVGTPHICVFGGFERSTSFTGGARHAPSLAVGPKQQCGCWQHNHACPKEIDMQAALHAVDEFVEEHVHAHR